MAASDIAVAGLTATNDVSGIKLAWTYSDPRSGALPNIALDMVEVYASATNDRATATKVGEGITDFLHAGLSRGAVRYYWIKARDNIGGVGAWHPASATAGVAGTELSGDVSIGTNGYWKHPSGLIIQWGAKPFGGGDTITFPIAFPNQCFGVVATPAAVGSTVEALAVKITSNPTTTSFKMVLDVAQSGGTVIESFSYPIFWQAIGY